MLDQVDTHMQKNESRHTSWFRISERREHFHEVISSRQTVENNYFRTHHFLKRRILPFAVWESGNRKGVDMHPAASSPGAEMWIRVKELIIPLITFTISEYLMPKSPWVFTFQFLQGENLFLCELGRKERKEQEIEWFLHKTKISWSISIYHSSVLL